jgi:hypothetical protein
LARPATAVIAVVIRVVVKAIALERPVGAVLTNIEDLAPQAGEKPRQPGHGDRSRSRFGWMKANVPR